MNSLMLYLTVVWLFPYTIVMSNYIVVKPPSCENFNRKYLKNFSLTINNSKLRIEMDLISPLHSGLIINIDFLARKYNSKNYRSVYQYPLDMCSMLNNQKNNMFKRWLSSFFAHGNLSSHCPVQPNHYYIKDYNINQQLLYTFPTFLYAGIYKISFNVVQKSNENKGGEFVVACSVEVKIK